MSMSAFIRASHRLRSMSLVSGYLLSQKGSLIAKISHRKDQAEAKWFTVFEQAELNVIFHPKYRRFQLDVLTTEEVIKPSPS
jgi:hypothetical protein